ncbi:MAG: PDZ domain-containing protein [Terriglobia bacterium]
MKAKTFRLVLILFAALVGGPLLFSAQGFQSTGRALPPGPGPVTVRVGEGRAWLGVELEDVTRQKAQDLKLPGVYGALVTRVEPGSPAAKAGVQVNDVILEFAGTRVWSVAQFQQWVRQTPPGRTVTLRVSRGGRKLDLKVTLGSLAGHEFPHRFTFSMPNIRIPEMFNFRFSPTRARLGIRGESLTPQLAKYFGVKQGKGVLVTEVENGTPAEKAGLKAGDCIVRLNSTDISSIFDLVNALNSAGKQPVTIILIRNQHEESVSVQLAPSWSPISQRQAERIQQSVQKKVQRLQRELPRLERREKQLESCLEALESHLFSAQPRPIEKTRIVTGAHGTWMVVGPGCPATGAGSGV